MNFHVAQQPSSTIFGSLEQNLTPDSELSITSFQIHLGEKIVTEWDLRIHELIWRRNLHPQQLIQRGREGILQLVVGTLCVPLPVEKIEENTKNPVVLDGQFSRSPFLGKNNWHEWVSERRKVRPVEADIYQDATRYMPARLIPKKLKHRKAAPSNISFSPSRQLAVDFHFYSAVQWNQFDDFQIWRDWSSWVAELNLFSLVESRFHTDFLLTDNGFRLDFFLISSSLRKKWSRSVSTPMSW